MLERSLEVSSDGDGDGAREARREALGEARGEERGDAGGSTDTSLDDTDEEELEEDEAWAGRTPLGRSRREFIVATGDVGDVGVCFLFASGRQGEQYPGNQRYIRVTTTTVADTPRSVS